MYRPQVPYTPQIYKNYQKTFGGYNHTASCGEGEIYDMKNIGHEEFPVITPRRGRNTAPAFDNGRMFPAYSETEIVRPKIYDIYAFDNAYVSEDWTGAENGELLKVGAKAIYWVKQNAGNYEMEIKGNNYVVAYTYDELVPAYINKFIVNKDSFVFRNDVKAHYYSQDKLLSAFGSGMKFKVGDVIGILDHTDEDEIVQNFVPVEYMYFQAIAEKTVKRMARDSGPSSMSLEYENVKFSDGKYKEETAEANTLTSETAFSLEFDPGDAVTISGCTAQPLNNKTAVIKEKSDDRKEFRFYENTFTLKNDAPVTETKITISREMPKMDFMCQCNNRVFGCKGDTIYASKLGDPYNWNFFEGISTDSYSVEVGSPGDFTACCAYDGDVLFFKEDRIYKLLNTDSSPENWRLVEVETHGVKNGCAKSLAIADSRLFWYSPKGMMQYSGSLPYSIAEAFGEQEFENAVGGSDGTDYYVCLKNSAGECGLFVFNTAYNLWFKHDDINVKTFVYHKGDLTALVEKENGDTEVIRLGQKNAEKPIAGEWNDMESMIEFGDVLNDTTNRKNKMNISVVAEVEEKGELQFYISCDGEPYRLLGEIKGKSKKQIHKFSDIPERCDYYRLKVIGKGLWKIYAISNGHTPGSDY